MMPMAEPARETEYATKSDVEVAVERLRAEIADVRTEIAAVESRLTWRLLGGVAALLTLFRLLDLLPGR